MFCQRQRTNGKAPTTTTTPTLFEPTPQVKHKFSEKGQNNMRLKCHRCNACSRPKHGVVTRTIDYWRRSSRSVVHAPPARHSRNIGQCRGSKSVRPEVFAAEEFYPSFSKRNDICQHKADEQAFPRADTTSFTTANDNIMPVDEAVFHRR